MIEIFPKVQIKIKKKRRLLEERNGRGRGIGCGHGRWQNAICDRGGRRGSGVGGGGGDPDRPYNTWNGVGIREISWYFSCANWYALQVDGQ